MTSRLVISKHEESLGLRAVRRGRILADSLVIVPSVGGSVALEIGHTLLPSRSGGS